MNEEKRKRLEAAGWKIGEVDEFLGLTPEEAAIVDMKFNLAKALYEKRKRLKTAQQRIALAEKRVDSVPIDFFVRSLLAVGASKKEIAVAMAR